MTHTVGLRYSHIKKNVLLWRPFFVEAPGQLPSLPSPKSGAGRCIANTEQVNINTCCCCQKVKDHSEIERDSNNAVLHVVENEE